MCPVTNGKLAGKLVETGTESLTDPENPQPGPGYGGTGGEGELSKEHWGSIDSWDSWE